MGTTVAHSLHHYVPPQGPLVIVHEDDDLLVVEKPAGLLSVPGKDPNHHDCLESRAKHLVPDARIVHRLDMATSGLMVLAKSGHAHRHLGLQFEKRQVQKIYRAIVMGAVPYASGMIDLPMRCDWPNRPRQRVDFDQGKPAQTQWQRVKTVGQQTELLLYPKTGRSHQLRVHLLCLGYPIVGDEFYAPQPDVPSRMMLHAETLTLRHPSGGAEMTFNAEAPFSLF